MIILSTLFSTELIPISKISPDPMRDWLLSCGTFRQEEVKSLEEEEKQWL